MNKLMAKWIKFSDRLPTEADSQKGEVIVQYNNGVCCTPMLTSVLQNPSFYADHFWLENTPELPKTRTIEDVAKDLLKLSQSRIITGDFEDLMGEMREILEREDNERF